MSKPIKMTQEYIEEAKQNFAEALKNAKMSDGKFTFTKSFISNDRKATLIFSEKAWMKMNLLVTFNDKEVGWHGTAFRQENDTYRIEDILVYPQMVDGTNVNTDQEKYELWLMTQPDEIFNNLRMQGHSHVNMSTTPSSVDIAHQEKILEQMTDDKFYIFLIWNKRGEKTIKIFDMAKNILFETSDITEKHEEEPNGFIQFLSESSKLVEKKQSPVYSGGYSNTNYYGGSSYGGYAYNGASYSGYQYGAKQSATQQSSAAKTGAAVSGVSAATKAASAKKNDGVRRGRRAKKTVKATGKTSGAYVRGASSAGFDPDDYDIYDD